MSRLLLHRATRIALLLLVLAGSAPDAFSQITITASDLQTYYASPATHSTYEAGLSGAGASTLQALAAQAGAGQTWDFSALSYAAPSQVTFTPVTAPAPGSDDPHFAQSNLTVRVDTAGTTDAPAWVYYRLDADEFTAYGSAVTDGDGVLRMLKFIPGETQPLPYTFGATWVSESQLVFAPEPFPGTLSVRKTSEVIGWGTLVTPGQSTPALMVRTVLVNQFSFPGAPASSDTSVVVSFMTEGTTSAFVYLDAQGAVQSGSYTTRAGATAGEPSPARTGRLLHAPSPNPGRGAVLLSYTLATAGHVRLAVYDALGREVAVVAEESRPAGTHAVSLDTSVLPSGMYVVRLEGDGAVSSTRLAVAR